MNNAKLFVANWKMNGSMDKIEQDFKLYLNSTKTNQTNVVFAIPLIYIAYVSKILETNSAKYLLASQDISIYSGFGPYTGEISGDMINDCGARYTIIGHSERRAMKDNHEILIQKLTSSINAKVKPIYCIGEDLRCRQEANYLKFLGQQLDILSNVKNLISLVIAYEPIWAIGTGLTSTSEQIHEVVKFIKGYIYKNFPRLELSILYGGSVNELNIYEIISIENIDGVLVGGASLKADEFIKICSYIE
ncbi:MAG: triose-phosphate isomerase [Burkholderiales bacterium]|nr:triose-phosphate isomerase [Burkholderiales bacterium]